MNRIEEHPIINFKIGEEIPFKYNGVELWGRAGDTIAGALIANDIKYFRITNKYKEKRSLFCGIGQCTDCSVIVDGIQNVKSCVTKLEANMNIFMQGECD
ncbi:MAG: sarcosine oxidase alpha subunit [Fusobacteria bacterium]|nr:MAG: sarcosine oxidase alpha subunit [Fusobacteriota bacterium]KAF0228494.1 MAG: sarcosine oxidase alpha [Fusobacteriota bacterium]